MNLKTTFVLVCLVGAGTGAWIWLDSRKPSEADASATLDFLQSKLSADKITRIDVTRLQKPLDPPYRAAHVFGLLAAPQGYGPLVASAAPWEKAPTNLFVLEKAGQEWTLPGNWPVRPNEAEQWLAVLTSLRSRFAPIALTGSDINLKPYGLDEFALTVKVTVAGDVLILRFGEEPEGPSRFTRSTFVRLEGKDEVIQLGPGVFAALDRKADYFQQRRLFPIERVAKEDDPKEKIEEVAASAVEVETKDTKFTIAKKDKDWILREAHQKKGKDWKHFSSEDRIDPVRRDAFLRGLPELWAEKFVENKSLQESGLNEPEFIVSVTKPNGKPVKLLIGKVSHSEQRFEMKQGPMGMQPRMIKEEYRYAKLDKNEQLFEIKADKLADITVALEELRDPQLARFKTEDVKRLEMRHKDQQIVLVKVKEGEKEKAKETWRFEKPGKDEADAKMIEEVLTKLAALQTRDKEIFDENEKSVRVGPLNIIKITLEEADKDASEKTGDKKADAKDAKKKTREIVFHLDVKETEKDKLYVRVDAWPRVNQVSAELWKLVSRPELAYRPRELWHLEREAITRITIQADSVPYHLNRAEKSWKISGPIDAEAVPAAIEALAEELTNLKAERFEATQIKDLAPFGLDKPAFKIDVTVKDGKPHGVEIGKQIAEGRYARLKDGNAVFVLSEKLTSQLRKDPFDLIEKNLLTLDPASIERIRFQGARSSFALESKKDRWQVLDSPAPPFGVDNELIKGVLGPWRLVRADKIVALGPKLDLARFGLDKPAATITVTTKATDKEKASEHVLELGKEAEGGRYARIDKKDTIALLDADAIADLQPTYLDFVDPRLLKFDSDAVMTIERKMKDADLELARREDNWLVTKPGSRDADLLTIHDVLKKTSLLRVKRIAAYPAKDLPTYGLDKPFAVVTLLLETDGNASKHVIKLGNLTKDEKKRETDERYAMIDDRPMVVVLSAELSRHLVAPAVYYADRNLAVFSSADRVELTHGNRKAVFGRSDVGWQMTEPVKAPAEAAVLEDLIRAMQRLRADEIVADKAIDLKKFGLDQPIVQWRFKLGDTEQLHLIVGAPENDHPGARRYGKLGDKNQVFLLSSKVSAKVLSEARARQPWEPFAAVTATKLSVVHGNKTFVLSQKDQNWQVMDDPAKKVDGKAVADTLLALEGLKALRYVADAKADLKAYGLAEPAWKIAVELPKDRRELWLGGYEDKSKRFFATVSGSGAVFVIDEADSARIARQLDAYLIQGKTEAKKRVLLLWHSPDGHPKETHEYQLGQKILKATLEKHGAVEATLVCADDPWQEGPELLAKADGVVLFISEGAKWLNANPERLAAFQACAKRNAGLVVLHWGMGTKDATNIALFVELFGGCHGGPDRKYKILQTEATVLAKDHPIMQGLADFKARDEFYYDLKFAKTKTDLLNVSIDGESYPVAWALERAGGGRSFGFSGLHFHENWQTPEYRRLVTQGVLWTLALPIPKDGMAVK